MEFIKFKKAGETRSVAILPGAVKTLEEVYEVVNSYGKAHAVKVTMNDDVQYYLDADLQDVIDKLEGRV